MARARNIKPGFFSNEILGSLPMAARLIFAGLWTIADREGRLQDRPTRIRAQLLPYDSEVNGDEMLRELKDAGFIQRYEVDGKKFIQVLTFSEHQHPHRDEKPSVIPESHESYLGPTEHGTCTIEAPCKPGTNPEMHESAPARALIARALIPGFSDCLENPLSAFEPESEPEIETEPEKPEPTPLELEIEEIAGRIHERHPAVRRCSLGEVRTQLRAIVRKLPLNEKLERLRFIDSQHSGWCESDDWQKDGGQYAKGLDNWLAPTKRRWENNPPEAAVVAATSSEFSKKWEERVGKHTAGR